LTSKHLENFYFFEILRVPNRNFIQKGEIYYIHAAGLGYPVGTKAKEKTRIGSAFSSFVRDARIITRFQLLILSLLSGC